MEQAYIEETFKDISIFGRTAYAILCFEEYVLAAYPDTDFTPVCRLMWHMLDEDGSFDDKAFFYSHIRPKCLYAYDSYDAYRKNDASGHVFGRLSPEQFELFRNIIPPSDSDLSTLMDNIFAILTDYLYGAVPYPAADNFPCLGACMDILNRLQLPLPAVSRMKQYRYGEGPHGDAWGNHIPYPGRSKILRTYK